MPEKKTYENEERAWQKNLQTWLDAGRPEKDDPKYKMYPKPGRHPNSNHKWNEDPD